jgi:putative N-acetylmannosamine-6-phosphate epimerase
VVLVNDRELAALLDMDGRHKPETIEARANGFFFARCSCGYLSARRRTPQYAVEALIHHMRKAGQELVSAGRVNMPAVRKHAQSMR